MALEFLVESARTSKMSIETTRFLHEPQCRGKVSLWEVEWSNFAPFFEKLKTVASILLLLQDCRLSFQDLENGGMVIRENL